MLIFKRLYYRNQERIMLINSLYLKEQLKKKNIEEYLKRILILIRRNEVKKTRKKVILDYKKLSKKTLETI